MLFARYFIVACLLICHASSALPMTRSDADADVTTIHFRPRDENLMIDDRSQSSGVHGRRMRNDVKLNRRLTPALVTSAARVAVQAGRMAVTYGRQIFSASKSAASGVRGAASGGKAASTGVQVAANGGKVATTGVEVATNGGKMAASGGKAATTGAELAANGEKAATVVTKGSKASTTLANVGNGAMIASLALPLLPMLKSSPKAETPTPAPATDPYATQPTTYDTRPAVPSTYVPASYTPSTSNPQPANNPPPVQYYPPPNSYAPTNPNAHVPTTPASYVPVQSNPYVPTQSTTYYPTAPQYNYGQPSGYYKRSMSDSPSSLQRRGDVANTAGAAVTGLMVLGLVKQLYGAIAIKFQAHQQVPAANPTYAYPSSPQLPYSSSPQYSAIHARSLDQTGAGSGEDKSMNRRGLMDAAGHFVTVGFAFQAVKDNTGPILREITRLQHEGMHQVKQLTNTAHGQQIQPLQLPPIQYQQQRMMYKRQVNAMLGDHSIKTKDDSKISLLRRASFMDHPAVGHGLSAAGVLVTVSMLTGMAGPYIDQGLKKMKDLMPASHPALPPAKAYAPQYTPQYTPQYSSQYMRKRSVPSKEETSIAEEPPIVTISTDAKVKVALVKRFSFKKWFKKIWNKGYKIYNDKWVVKALAIVGWNGKMELLRNWK